MDDAQTTDGKGEANPYETVGDYAPNLPSPPRLPRNVWLLGWLSLINDVASEMAYPLLPALITALPGGKVYLGLMEGVAATTASLLKLFSGAWSDRLRRRKVFLVAGYGLAVISRPLMGLAGAAWQLVALRTADRIGKGLRTPPRDAMIADCTPPAIRGRAFGVQRAMDQFGAALGPLFAFAILHFWPGHVGYVLLATLAPGILVLVLLVVGLRETEPQSVAAPTPLKLTLAPFGSPFRLYLVTLIVFTLGNTSDMFLITRSGELGVPLVWIPMLWCAFNVISGLGSLAAGPMIDRLGAKLPILGGWLLYAAVYCGFALATSAWQAWALFLSYALFYSLTEPAEKALVAQLADGKEHRGLAYGWFNCAVGIATLPANLFFGWLYLQYGALAAFGFGAAMALLAAVLLLAVRMRTPAVAY